MLRSYTFVLAFVLIASSVAASPHPRLTRPEVIRLANAQIPRHGYDRKAYALVDACYNCVNSSNDWWVSYQRRRLKRETTDNHFSVVIADKTGKIVAFIAEGRVPVRHF
jgi:hypothetical protein